MFLVDFRCRLSRIVLESSQTLLCFIALAIRRVATTGLFGYYLMFAPECKLKSFSLKKYCLQTVMRLLI